LEFRTRIIELYADLFGESTEEDEEKGFGEFSKQHQFSKQWGWYTSIYELAQGNVTRFDEVTRLPIHQFLTALLYIKQKGEL